MKSSLQTPRASSVNGFVGLDWEVAEDGGVNVSGRGQVR